MLSYIGNYLQQSFGPARLLTSNIILIGLFLYFGFFITWKFLPKFYNKLPHDRGREFTLTAEAAKGKPTGAGVIFITMYVLSCLIFTPMQWPQYSILILIQITMLTGYLDDRSVKSWGEYLKALLDLIICIAATTILYIYMKDEEGKVYYWLPLISSKICIHPVIFFTIGIILLWASINTTNCTDGVDGLSSTLVLIALITLGIIFYFILGHKGIADYLLVPWIADGAIWAIMIFGLAGVLMGYLWHNAFPSSVLMGDAGSRALGFFIGTGVLLTQNPLMIFATSSIIFINGGMGLLKVALLRFFNIKIFSNVRFPLHDHMRKNHGWSPAQVLVKFMIMQILITVVLIGLFFKIR